MVPFLMAEHSGEVQVNDNETSPFTGTIWLKLSTATTGISSKGVNDVKETGGGIENARAMHLSWAVEATNPGKQGRQALWVPALDQVLPTQGKHNVLFSPANVPPEHVEHCITSRSDVVPRGQLMQSAERFFITY
jgi:hypothetical protein